MYAAIRQGKAKAGTAAELTDRIKEGAIPIISDVPGPDDTVTAIGDIDDILAEAVREARHGPVQAVVIIGDNFHGGREEILAHAEQLRAAGTRLFLFRQSSQRAFPGDVFRTLAEMTKGAYYEFNPSIERVAERLPRLFETVIHCAIGGPAALRALSDESADFLLEQIK